MVLYRRSQVRSLPKIIQDYLKHKFNLPAEYPGTLRCLANMKSSDGELNAMINIFSPAKAQEYRLDIRTAADLRRYPEIVLFKGHIDSRGGINIADRRGPGRGYLAKRHEDRYNKLRKGNNGKKSGKTIPAKEL